VDPRATDVVIIDEPLAAALYPGQDPLGQMLTLAGKRPRTVHVIGVAPGLRQALTDKAPVPHVYLPLGPSYETQANVHVRAAAGSAINDLRTRLRDVVRMEDARLAVLGLQTLDEVRDTTGKAWVIRSAGQTFGAFGGIALLMATIGLYGVKAYIVARRTREIGIRMALGANAGDVVRMVVREGAVLLGASIAVGFLLAIGLGQAISSLLVGVHAFDPLVLFMSSAVLCLAVLAACYLPARRATKVEPTEALRTL
jgi:ABC-type antimicrobial peptide transport system permease subunit